ANSPADVLLTVDIGRIEDAVRAGITQPIKSNVLDKIVAPQYRDPEGHWYGISMRARVVYASKDRVRETALNYEDLADPKWKGKICIRSGQYIYNNALFAAFIAHHGEAKTEEWLSGLKANLAQKPSGGDREVARDIAAGKCYIGVANTYYWRPKPPGVKLGLIKSIASTREPGSGPLCPGLVPQEARTRDKTVRP